MKILKYLGSAILLLLGIGQLLPIYLISSGLLQGQAENETSYFIGKLLGHIVITIIILAIASKLYKSAKNSSHGTNNASV
jgi:hypothetical protein